MQALGASYRAQGPAGARRIAARDFYEAAFSTALNEDEVLTHVHIPLPPAGHGAAYEKQKRKVGDYATAGAAVVLSLSGGTCTAAAIALTNVGDTPLFAEAASSALVGTPRRRGGDLRGGGARRGGYQPGERRPGAGGVPDQGGRTRGAPRHCRRPSAGILNRAGEETERWPRCRSA